MAVSTFATPTTGFTPLYLQFSGALVQAATVEIPVGYYEFSWFPDSLSAATTFGTFTLVDSAGTKTTYTTVDNESTDARNVSVIYVNVTVPIVSIETASQTGNMLCRYLGAKKTVLTGSAVVYSTSQSITLANASPCILEGGGGGGGGGSSISMRGNGGGSGYFQFFTAPPGTYAFVAGAYGAPGTGNNHDGQAGGASTFAGYTAGGGAGGRGAGYGGSNAMGGAAGGAAGGGGATPTGFPSWKTPGAGGSGGSGGGGGGCIGAGGNGPADGSSNTTGGAGVQGGGGSGGSYYSSYNFSGNAGGVGALAILVWS